MEGNDVTHPGNDGNKRGKCRLNNSGRYVRELSIVVVGVAITFLASGWLSNHREKKELEGHLEAVKIELQSNLEIIRETFMYYDQLLRLSHYIQSKSPAEHTPEGISRAAMMENGVNVMERLYFYVPVETASFDALKESGTARHLRDQQVWRSIMKSYQNIEELKNESDTYMTMKINYIYNSLRDNKISDQAEFSITSPEMRDLYNFYRSSFSFNDVFERTFEAIDQTLSYLGT